MSCFRMSAPPYRERVFSNKIFIVKRNSLLKQTYTYFKRYVAAFLLNIRITDFGVSVDDIQEVKKGGGGLAQI